jgi:hypothetical protein
MEFTIRTETYLFNPIILSKEKLTNIKKNSLYALAA